MSDREDEDASNHTGTRSPVSNGWVFALSMTAALATGAWLILSEAPGGAQNHSFLSVGAQSGANHE